MQHNWISWWSLILSFSFGICERSFQAASDSYIDLGEYGQLVLAFGYFLVVWRLMPRVY